jgi:hypothetical protein
MCSVADPSVVFFRARHDVPLIPALAPAVREKAKVVLYLPHCGELGLLRRNVRGSFDRFDQLQNLASARDLRGQLVGDRHELGIGLVQQVGDDEGVPAKQS